MFEFTIHQGELVSGSSRRPTNIEVNETGIGIGAFKRTMHAWPEISEVIIDGPQSRQSRVTATRLVALGVFALAARKNTTETLVTICLKTDRVITVMFNKKSEIEVKAIFARYAGRLSTPEVDQSGPVKDVLPIDGSKTSKSRAEQLNDLFVLLDRGLIEEHEFFDLKAEILQAISSTAETAGPETSENIVLKKAMVPLRPEFVNGEIDEDGIECIVGRPSDDVVLSIINHDRNKIDSLVNLMMSLCGVPSDRKLQKKLMQGYRSNFFDGIGGPVMFIFPMHLAMKVIDAFEEMECEVKVASSHPPHEHLPRGSYRFIEISENQDPFDTPDLDDLIGVGIFSWNGMNEDRIIDVLWSNSLKSPVSRYLDTDQIPATISSWFMLYRTSLEIFPVLDSLGCKAKRIKVIPPDLAKRLVANT
jgi:hypothetical protein